MERPVKETYKRDLKKRPIKKTYERDHKCEQRPSIWCSDRMDSAPGVFTKETYERDL